MKPPASDRPINPLKHAEPLRGPDQPEFAEPWQAQAFALVVILTEAGCFSWQEWARTLGAQLRGAEQAGDRDDGSRYYHHWVTALEKLVSEKGLSDPEQLVASKRNWLRAYRDTPHGQPVIPASEGPQ